MSDGLHHQRPKFGPQLTLDEVVDLLPPSAGGRVQLEGPQEVRGVLEVGSHGEHLGQGVILGRKNKSLKE